MANMNAVAKKEIEAQVVDRLGHVFERHEKRPPEILTSGIVEIDQVLGGFPRGAITEIHGAASCGRTSLLLATLAAATSSEETCALIDCSDTFDLLSATRAGVNLDQLLWVRCNYHLERAFKSTDLLLHGGGFGLIALSLADMPARTLRRIISTWWFRFRRAIEDTPTVLLVMSPVTCARSCAAMALELKNEGVIWPATTFPEAKDLPKFDDRSAQHLSLVGPGDRNASHRPGVPGHTHFLRTTTICVNRERPVDWVNQTIRFTPQLALTMFGDIR
jgi:hypothetical protein